MYRELIANVQERDKLIELIEGENLARENKWKVLLELFQHYSLSIELLDTFPFTKFKVDIKEGVFAQIESCKKEKSHECFSRLVGANFSLKEVDDWIDEFALGKLKYHRTLNEQNVINETKACMNGTRWTDCSAVCTKAGWNVLVGKCSKDSYKFSPGTLINTILSDSCGPEWSITDRVAALKGAGCSFDPYSQLAIFDNIKHLDPHSFPWIKLPSMVSGFYIENLPPATNLFFLFPYLKPSTSNKDKALSGTFGFSITLYDGYFLSSGMVNVRISKFLEIFQSLLEVSKIANPDGLEQNKRWVIILLVRARILLNRNINGLEMSRRSNLLELPKFCNIVTASAKEYGESILGLLDSGQN